ncbi:MAG: dTDP-4-dehydrorhamnose 3,5-epimerase [Bacteroidales bacterium]
MNIRKTPIPGLVIIEPSLFEDSRGYFFESYNKRDLANAGIVADFIQDNQSMSGFGVVRGLHYQLAPYSQAKLVRVLEGSVWDVVVDLRKGSPAYGQAYSLEISQANRIQLFIPKGLAHGFAVTSQKAVFFYKCDEYYHPDAERGIHCLDPALNLDWPVGVDQALISNKDRTLPLFADAEKNFIYS